ncbi:MAG: MauE/DoxX family redox-associated membrane protein [Pseudomonadota bacterium]
MEAIVSLAADPGLLLALRWVLATVFVIGVAHKLAAPADFVAALGNYELLPRALTAPVARVLIGFEAAAALALLADTRAGGGLAAALLVLYTLAIAVNLVRDRRNIDCGCAGPGVRRPLSGWLVARNGALIALAAMTAMPHAASRTLTALDWFTAVCAFATAGLAYTAAQQLAASRARFGA